MKKLILSFAALALLLGGVGQAKADLVYDNGPINGTITGWTINFGYVVSDSFTVSSATSLTGAQIGLWAAPGDDNPTSVQWSIGSATYGSDISSGTGVLSSTYQYTNGYGYDILKSTFSLTGSVAAGTTYWFTLQNAVLPSGNPIYWDQNNGPSTAYENSVGQLTPPNGSESFQLYGTSAVPEPSTVTLLTIGVVGLVGYRWRRRKSVTA
jgi:PEP-CTERM motif